MSSAKRTKHQSNNGYKAKEGYSDNKDPYTIFILILAAGFLLRVILSLFFTYENDFLAWKIWGSQISEVGFTQFYDKFWCDYMPGYLYILWALDHIKSAFFFIPTDILYKLPANLADLGISISIFYALRGLTTTRNAMIAAVIYLFNPAALSNSTFWGQVDSFHALPILLSIITALGRRFVLAGIFAALAFMIKPPSIVVFPMIGLIAIAPLFREYKRPTLNTFLPAIKVGLAIVVTCTIVTLPFIWDQLGDISYLFTGPLELIRARFSAAYDQYTFASLNAFNFWGSFAMWQDDSLLFLGIKYKSWGTMIFMSIFTLIGALLIRVVYVNKGSDGKDFSYLIYQAITLVIFALFLFITRAHERHLLPAIVFFTVITFRHWILWCLYAIVSSVYVLNMTYSYIQLTTKYKAISWDYARILLPVMFALYLLAFLYLLYDFVKNTLKYKGTSEPVSKEAALGN